MNNFFNFRPHANIEKNQVIRYLKNEVCGYSERIDNAELLEHYMNVVEMYFNKKGTGRIKEEVIRSIFDFCSKHFLDEMIPYIVKKGILKNKTI